MNSAFLCFDRIKRGIPFILILTPWPGFLGDHYPDLPNTRPVILRKKTTWEGFEEYLRSYSSLRNFQDCHPTDRERADGDIVVRFMEKIKKGMREEDGAADDDVVEIEWPLALIMAKRA